MELITTNNQPTMTSVQLVDYINEDRKLVAEQDNGKYIELLHKNFMAKVPEVLGHNHAAKFLASQKYGNNNERNIYILPERESILMAMSYSYSLQAKVYDLFQSMKSKIESINPNQIMLIIANMQKQFIELNSNVTALLNNLAIKHEPKVETPKYFQPSNTKNSNEDVHLYHRITIYGKKFRPDLDQSQIRERAKEIGMMASRFSKERNIQIIKEDNLDGRFQNKISYYHQNVLKEVFDLIF